MLDTKPRLEGGDAFLFLAKTGQEVFCLFHQIKSTVKSASWLVASFTESFVGIQTLSVDLFTAVNLNLSVNRKTWLTDPTMGDIVPNVHSSVFFVTKGLASHQRSLFPCAWTLASESARVL